jgi:ABC-type antimicrobial peptide transport system permease subunit
VYGVISFAVKMRTREFGVRLALGATRRNILGLVIGNGVRQMTVGIGVGVLLALGASALLTSTLVGFDRSAYTLWIYLAVVLLLTGVGAAALFIPARRASRVDPLVALRAE